MMTDDEYYCLVTGLGIQHGYAPVKASDMAEQCVGLRSDRSHAPHCPWCGIQYREPKKHGKECRHMPDGPKSETIDYG